MYEIKENERALNSEWRFYITKNNKVVKQQLTLKQAKQHIKDIEYLRNEK